jgi:VWFA-related protein
MKRLAAIVLLSAACWMQAGMQTSPPVLRELIVTVRDNSGRLVPNLNAGAFQLEESGVLQTITQFSENSQQPASIGLLIDARPSMANFGGLVSGIGALRTLVRSSGIDDDEFSIMTFDTSFKARKPVKGVEEADKALRLLYPQDLAPNPRVATSVTLLNAIQHAFDEMRGSSHRHRILIVATAGADIIPRTLPNISSAEIATYVIGFRGTTVVLQPEPPPIPLFSENYTQTQASAIERWLGSIAESTGGRAELFLSNEGQAIDRMIAFAKEVGAEVRGQYRLGYYSNASSSAAVRVRAGQFRVRSHRLFSEIADPQQN